MLLPYQLCGKGKMADTYLGLDLGGTKLLIGEMDRRGTVLWHKKYPSGALDQASALQCLERSLDDYLASVRPPEAPPPLAMGIGLIGRVDNRRGIWYEIDSHRSGACALAEIFSRRSGLACFVENDVRSAVTAELTLGHGREQDDFIYINLGTGIAAGFVSGGRILRGGNCNAGEIGHTLVGVDPGLEIPCECGRVNCVETFASGMGLDKCSRLLREQYPDTALIFPEDGPVSARELFEKSGTDPLCARLTDTAVRGIANLIMNLVRTTDPAMVVLGGGLMSDGFLYPRVLEALDRNTMRFVNQVVLTQLAPAFAGLLGAGTVAMRGLESRKKNAEALC
jgi:predicted NBD/HSP70 family sugar kinase